MRDPHVESLCYKLKTSETTTYDNPPAVEVIRNEFECCLKDGILTCLMREWLKISYVHGKLRLH